MLPQEMGCGSGMTWLRRLRDWQAAGVWQELHQFLLDQLCKTDQIDWSLATVDRFTVWDVGGGVKTDPTTTDRRKRGSQHHVLTDANGIPLDAIPTGANRHDVTRLLPLVDSTPPVAGKRGHPKRRPASLYADPAYDSTSRRTLAPWD
jgi:transposase